MICLPISITLLTLAAIRPDFMYDVTPAMPYGDMTAYMEQQARLAQLSPTNQPYWDLDRSLTHCFYLYNCTNKVDVQYKATQP